MSLSVQEERLTPRSADPLLAEFLACVHRSEVHEVLEMDLDRLSFIDPYGLIVLCLMGRYARLSIPRVVLRTPASRALRSYLGRVRFAEALEGVATLEGAPLLVDQEREKPDSEALMEITRIEEQADVEALLGRIGQRVEAILAEELRYTEVEINQFKNVVAELCHNILDHSMNWGYATAQRYLDQQRGMKYVIIGVGDLGIGIKKSLAQRYADEAASWSHGQAVLKSLKKNFSRDPMRGLGLYVVNQICHRYNGSLHIRTGDTRVYIRGRRHYEHCSVHFPGTLIGIALYEHNRAR